MQEAIQTDGVLIIQSLTRLIPAEGTPFNREQVSQSVRQWARDYYNNRRKALTRMPALEEFAPIVDTFNQQFDARKKKSTPGRAEMRIPRLPLAIGINDKDQPHALPAPLDPQGLINEMVEQITRTLKAPHQVEALLAIGERAVQQHEDVLAGEAFDWVQVIGETNRWYEIRQFPLWIARAKGAMSRQLRNEAHAHYDHALRVARDERLGNDVLGVAAIANALIDTGFMSEALDIARTLALSNEAFAVVVRHLIDTHHFMQAELFIKTMDQSRPTRFDASYRYQLSAHLVRTWVQQKRFDEAFRMAQTLIPGNGDDLSLVQLFENHGQPQMAMALLDRMGSIERVDVLARQLSLLATLENTPESSKAFNRLWKKFTSKKYMEGFLSNDSWLETCAGLGVSLVKAGRIEEAADAFKALEAVLEKSEPESRYGVLSLLVHREAEVGLFDEAEKKLQENHVFGYPIAAAAYLAGRIAEAGDRERAERLYTLAGSQRTFGRGDERVALAISAFEHGFAGQAIAVIQHMIKDQITTIDHQHLILLIPFLIGKVDGRALVFLMNKSAAPFMEPSSFGSFEAIAKEQKPKIKTLLEIANQAIDGLLAVDDFENAVGIVRELWAIPSHRFGYAEMAHVAIVLARKMKVALQLRPASETPQLSARKTRSQKIAA